MPVFPFFYFIGISINGKTWDYDIRFISYQLIFIAFQEPNQQLLLPTSDVVKIHMTSN